MLGRCISSLRPSRRGPSRSSGPLLRMRKKVTWPRTGRPSKISPHP